MGLWAHTPKSVRDKLGSAIGMLEDACRDAKKLIEADRPYSDEELLSLVAAVNRRLHNGMNSAACEVEAALHRIEVMNAAAVAEASGNLARSD